MQIAHKKDLTSPHDGLYDSPIVVARNEQSHLGGYPSSQPRGCDRGSFLSGFFVSCIDYSRGYHPPLVNVEATDTDKRGELALLSLGEHPSGKRQVGLDKSAALKSGSLDKRELLSTVDNIVDNLPTGLASGEYSMR